MCSLKVTDDDGNIAYDVLNVTIVKIFNNASTYYISATTLIDDNSYGTFVIYDANGNIVKGETVSNCKSTSDISTTILNNGSLLIAYKDSNFYGTLVTINGN